MLSNKRRHVEDRPAHGVGGHFERTEILAHGAEDRPAQSCGQMKTSLQHTHFGPASGSVYY